MKAKEFRDKSKEELTKILDEKREKVRAMRFDIATKQVKNVRDIRKDKRDISRILTIINEK